MEPQDSAGVETTATQRRRRLVALLSRPNALLVAPGVGDGLGARLVERAGFEAVYASGYAIEGTMGNADVGLLGLSDVAGRLAQITEVTSLPVIADADAGYGNAMQVARTVRAFDRAGVAALQLEDQEMPKRCGSMPGKAIVPIATMVGKIQAALDARSDRDLLVIARTDALQGQGLEAALERLAAYRDAGADLLMCLGPYDRATAEELCRRTPGPLAYLNAESLTMPIIPPEDLRRMGVPLVIYPTSLVLAAARSMRDTLQEIARTGTTEPLIGSALVAPKEFNEWVGLDAIQAAERKYGL